jgi:hypothetical protein
MGNLDDLLKLTINFRLPGRRHQKSCATRSTQRAHGTQINPTAGLGHKDQFPPPGLTDRYRADFVEEVGFQGLAGADA